MPAQQSLLLSVLPWILVVTSTTLSFPQIWISCFRGRTHGLDLTASLLAPALSVSWLTYGLLLQDPVQIVTNSLTGTCNAAILGALLMQRADLRRVPVLTRALPLPALLCVSVLGTCSLVGTGMLTAAVAGSVVGTIAVAFTFVALVPQPLALLRDRTQDMSGLSLGRFSLTVFSAALWALYGALTASPVVVSSAALGAGSAAVVIYCVVTQKRHVEAPAVASTTLVPVAA